MAFDKNRSRPIARHLPYTEDMPKGIATLYRRLGRSILLSTGRGDCRLSADEAEMLATELLTAAKQAREQSDASA